MATTFPCSDEGERSVNVWPEIYIYKINHFAQIIEKGSPVMCQNPGLQPSEPWTEVLKIQQTFSSLSSSKGRWLDS